MADRYWVSGGTGNYNSTTNWSATSGGASGASVPTTVDNAFFNASSGVGTVTITLGSNCANLNLTGFTGNLSFANDLTVNGIVLNLGTGGYTVSGASNLVLAGGMTITTNGTIYTGNVNFSNLVTYTLADNFSITGKTTFSSGATTTVNGNNLNIGGDLLFTSNGNVVGTTTFVLNGTGTWNHTGFTTAGVIRNNININTSGTITLGASIRWGNVGGTFSYTAGTVVTTGNTFFITQAGTWSGNLNTNGITWNNITIPAGGSAGITLLSNLTLTGTLTVSGGFGLALGGNSFVTSNANLVLTSSLSFFTLPANQTFKSLTSSLGTITSNTLTLTENLTLNSGGVTGTANIVYAGTGTWTASDSTAIIENNFTINTTGTLTILGVVYKGRLNFTYTAGTVVDSGATVVVGSSASATTCNISGKTWGKLLIAGAITLSSNINATTFGTTGSSNVSFTLSGNTINFTHLELGNTATTTLPSAWSCQNIEFKNTGAGVLNSNSITINGNILQSGAGAYTGTTTITYAGTGTWSRTNSGYFSNNVTINTAGTLTISGANIGGGIFTYTAGTVVTTGSTLWNRVSGTTFNHGGIVFNNVIFGLSEGSGSVASVTLNNQLVCLGTLTLGISDTTFGGMDGTFDVYNLVLGTDLSGLKTTTLLSTKTYTVRQSFTSLQANNSNKILMRSSVGGSMAKFTVNSGSTLNVGYVNATDIDSSLGITIFSFNGVITNSLNWKELPPIPEPSTFVFVN